MKRNVKMLGVHLKPEIHEYLKKKSERTGISISFMVRKMIERQIEEDSKENRV